MSTTEQWILQLYGVLVFVWIVRHVVYTWIVSRIDTLGRQSACYSGPKPPKVSVIIPAKDEEATLADCLESICAQRYEPLEIVIVNDRSSDATQAIARRFCERDPRVRLINIEHLPEGWTGKTHALHVSTREADGDWFWFVDSDTRHHPDALSMLLEYARKTNAALVSLMPELRCDTFWEKVLQPLEGIVLMRSFSPLAVNNDRSTVGFANGQCLLIERETYVAVGGHDAVRGRFVEDIYMAQNVKASGRPIRLAIGAQISSTRMYTSLAQITRGWSRILYDALGRRPGPLIWKIVEPLIYSQTGDIALIASLVLLALRGATPFAVGLFVLSLIHQVLKTLMLYRMYKLTSPRTAGYAVWYVIAGIISAWISLDAIRSCMTGKVTWRGTSYRPASAAPPPISQGVSTVHDTA